MPGPLIYMDPPYGVKFGSNFQPFVRRRDVKHNEDNDLTREPEMVQAYRDTWELGLHSYLTYLRGRLLLCRELLAPTGSIFVQISDENLHHVREVMDEVFGAENFVSVISFSKTSSASGDLLSSVADYLLWYAKDSACLKYRQLYIDKQPGEVGGSQYTWIEMLDGTRKNLGSAENLHDAPEGSRLFVHDNLTSQRPAQGNDVREFEYEGRTFKLRKGTFKTDKKGLENLSKNKRLIWIGDTLRYVRFLSDFPVFPLNNVWNDTGTSGFAASKLYVVQTNPQVIQRCILRLLTASFDYYELADEKRGPGGGFVYKRRQNSKGEEVGGMVPHITLKSIANDEPPAEEVLVDRPEVQRGIVRVTGPFTVEATIPTAAALDEEQQTPVGQSEDHRTHVERMIEVLRRAPVLRLPGNQAVTLRQVRPPAKTLSQRLDEFRRSRRVQELVFDVAAELTKLFRSQRGCEIPAHALFPQPAGIVRQYAEEKVKVQALADRRDLFLAPYYGWLVEALLNSLKGDVDEGEAAELPVLEASRGPGSTAEVDFWTSREVREVRNSQVNFVVADTKRWEQSAAYFLDTHANAAAFVKNAGLGLGIPYLHNGEQHEYVPDFVVRLNTADEAYLLIETKGYDPLKEIKKAAAERWCSAVNAHGGFGNWAYRVVDRPEKIPQILDARAITAES
jgi:hypothetical protein